jgi:hypothetical protein
VELSLACAVVTLITHRALLARVDNVALLALDNHRATAVVVRMADVAIGGAGGHDTLQMQ